MNDMAKKRQKTAVVVGANANLGSAIVKALKDKGWVVDPTWLGPDRPDGRKEESYKHLPPVIDLAVYVAGINEISPTQDLSLEKWQSVMDTNLTGAFLFAKNAFEGMKASGGATFVAISSINSVHPYPGRAAYTASKAGLEGLIRALAIEWGEHGISTHAIRLGHLKGLMKKLKTNPKLAGLLDAVVEETPLHTLIDPATVASYILWLAEGGSRNISGCVIDFEPAYTINRYPIER